MFQSLLKDNKEILDVLRINLAEGTQSECICSADFAGVNGKAALIAIVMHFLEVPVGIVGIFHGYDKSRLNAAVNGCFQSESVDTFVYGLVYSTVAGKFGCFAFFEILFQSLNGGVDGLYGRCEVHFAGLLKICILHIQVAVV